MVKPRPDDEELLKARSYDDVAEAYERVNAPLMFDAPGRALVACAGVKPGDRVLDVGAGTGAVARAAVVAAASAGSVVALDPSVSMLLAARRGGVVNAACGSLPGLPFSTGVFDVVLSAFVLTHVDDPDASARDMHRVLRPGGRIALSAWSPAEDAYTATWAEVVHEFAPRETVSAAAERVLPGETRFAQREGMAGLLETNGFVNVRTEARSFVFDLSLDAMISSREVCASGRALRALLSDAEWDAFQRRVRDVLGKKFPDGTRYDRLVFMALGEKR